MDGEKKIGYIGFATQRLEMLRNGWLQARYYSDADSTRVKDFLSYDDVYEVNPFEVGGNHGKARRAYGKRFAEVAELLELKELLPRAFVSLSNGETRRVMLARELLKDPDVLEMEDPFNGLDFEQRAKVRRIIAELRARGVEVVVRGDDDEDLRESGKDWVRSSADARADRRSVVSFNKITVKYGKKVLYKDFSWTIREGEKWVLRGKNGSGKTTLMALITGDSPLAYSLDVEVFGVKRDIGCNLNAIREKIAMVSPEMQAYLGKDPETLLDEALKKRPKLLILDEPCMNLDLGAARGLCRKVATYLKKHPKTAAICIAHRPEHVPEGFDHELSLDACGATRDTRLLLLTPPLLQTNTPYPATMHLTGFLESKGCDVHQRDLSIKVVRDVLLEYGDETTEELLEFLGGNAPPEAKREASEIIDELALAIRDEIDPDFGFSRYAEHLCQAVEDFGALEKRIKRRGVMDAPLERHLKEAMEEIRPTIVGVTCPFPGTLVGAFKIAAYVKKHYPGVKLVLGGGYVSTELREMTDPRPYAYFDLFQFDEGYEQLLNLLQPPAPTTAPTPVPVFVKPSYRGIDWNEYFDVVETDNFVTALWSSGKWVKLIMARGCYWHRCAFCDVKLPYIGCFEMPKASEIVDAMQELGTRFHFVDEAMPPALVRGVCEEILRRDFVCEWWGNVRFDTAFTPELTKLMAKAGCVCVTGGLECANDRLLKLMNKGITLASAEKVLENFKAAEIFVHTYLMYDFPTETKAEQKEAEKYVRSLGRKGLIQSCFWHRFALTVHSPIAREPEKFGICIREKGKKKRVFARNEIEYDYIR